MAVRSTVVGSWWWPPGLSSQLRQFHDGSLDEATGERVLAQCAAAAIEQQRALGLDEWTGGEYFTDNFVNHLQRVISGIVVDREGEHELFDYDDVPHARIVGEIDAPDGLGYLSAYLSESQLPGGVNKATVVTPLEITAHEADQAALRDPQLPRVTEIVNAEIRGLAQAGCPHVQLDAPAIGIAINMGQMTSAAAAAMIAGCFEGVTGTVRGLHICNGNLKGRPASGVLRNATWLELLQMLDGVIDVANLECSYFSEWLERDAFRDLPASMEFAAGIVDEANYWVEPVSKIRARAADWARVIGEERLWLSPSCGFGRHPARDRPVLEAKVANMVEAAATL